MPMPKVSSEIITSIREQTMRSKDEPYCINVLKDMQDENPDIHEAILASTKAICTAMNMDLMDREQYNHMLNILNLASSVYQAIKQQIVVNELEDSLS